MEKHELALLSENLESKQLLSRSGAFRNQLAFALSRVDR